MEKYIEILDSLMKAKKEKKKKEPTIKEKEAFRSAWLSLVADAGLTGSAEQFLYDLAGVRPVTTEISFEALEKMSFPYDMEGSENLSLR